ncbi:MAG: DUF547 domain-containing protein, partial [Pseudomonadota bacterium]
MKLNKTLTLLALLLSASFAHADSMSEKSAETTKTNTPSPEATEAGIEGEKKQPVGFDHSHKLFTEVLGNFVIVSGAKSTVNYKGLKKSPSQLNSYLGQLSAVSKKDYAKFSKEQKMAFLINAYNGFTLKLIIDNYPVKSIKDIGGLFSSPWKKEFFKLLGGDMYLDKIEHKILRKKFKEPRIHFAVNCASIGCPALRGEAFTADRLNVQLEEQAKIFLRDSSRNSIKKSKKEIHLSKIFDWFDGDFKRGGSSVQKFVAPYMTD